MKSGDQSTGVRRSPPAKEAVGQQGISFAEKKSGGNCFRERDLLSRETLIESQKTLIFIEWNTYCCLLIKAKEALV